MTQRSLTTLLLIFLSTFLLQAQTADEIIDRHFEITGGKAKWENVESIRMQGKTSMQGMEFPMILTMKKPDKVRTDVSVQGKEIITAFDGTVGWTVNPFTGQTKPTKLPEDQLLQFENQQVEDQLLNYVEKGHSATYAGTGEYEGTPCHKVTFTKKDGSVETHFFDKESGVRILTETIIPEGPSKGQTLQLIYSEYNEANGLIFPFSMTTRIGGQALNDIQLEDIEVNPKISGDIFALPK